MFEGHLKSSLPRLKAAYKSAKRAKDEVQTCGRCHIKKCGCPHSGSCSIGPEINFLSIHERKR